MTLPDVTKTSYSSLTKHRECPQAWGYSRMARLESSSQSASISRDFGTWGHAWLAVDSMRRGVRSGTLRSHPEAIQLGNGDTIEVSELTIPGLNGVEKDLWHRLTSWWKMLPEEVTEEWVDAIGEPAPKRLANIVRGYRRRWSEADSGRKVLGVEVTWERELSSGTVLSGVVDLVELDSKRNIVVATDHKFKKKTEQSVEDDLLDSQLQFYSWGASPLVEEWGYGPIKAISYNRIRSVAGKTPVLTATGSLSKSVTDFDLQTYLMWASGPDGNGVQWGVEGEYVKTGKNAGKPKFGVYTVEPEMVSKLSSTTAQDVWFSRTFTPISSHVIATHLMSADETARRIPETVERWKESGDAARNFSYACRFCEFKGLCAAQMIGGPEGDYPLEDFGLQVRPRRQP